MNSLEPAPWQEGTCNVPMWMGGCPDGKCGKKSYGHQLPEEYLYATRGMDHRPYCFGHACPSHGGPHEAEVRIFQDGYTAAGRRMWCAVMPDFVNLQESPAGFSGSAARAVAKLKETIAKATGDNP